MKNFFSWFLLLLCTTISSTVLFSESPFSSLDVFKYYTSKTTSWDSVHQEIQLNSAQLKYGDSESYILHVLGSALYYKSHQKYVLALDKLDELEENTTLQKTSKLLASFCTLKGIILNENSRYDQSRKMYHRSWALYKELSDSSGIKGSMINIGTSYFHESVLDSALFYFNSAEQFDPNGTLSFQYNLLLNLAVCHHHSGHIELSQEYYQKLFSLFPEQKNNDIFLLYNYGILLDELGNTSTAIAYLEKALYQHNDNPSTLRKSKISLMLATLYNKEKMHEKATQLYAFTDSIRKIEDETTVQLKLTEQEHQKHLDSMRLQRALDLQTISHKKESIQRLWLFIVLILTLSIITIRQFWLKEKKNKKLAEKSYELSKLKTKNNTPKNSKEIIQKLDELILTDEIYRQPNLNLERLSRKLKTNRTYLSESINEHYKMSFRSFLNKHRIEKAQELLTTPSHSHFSIEGIAELVGFKSSSTFNSQFKKETGVTPSYYRNKYS